MQRHPALISVNNVFSERKEGWEMILQPVLFTKSQNTKLVGGYLASAYSISDCKTYYAELKSGEAQARTVIETIANPPMDHVTRRISKGVRHQ